MTKSFKVAGHVFSLTLQDGSEFVPQTLAGSLVEKYGIDMETALKDASNLARKWVEAGVASE